MSPRSCSGGPKSGPRGPKTAPSRPQEPPGAPQEAPKSSQERTKRAPREPLGAQGPPRSLPGLILGGPGLHFQAIEASVSKLARAPPDNRKHSSKSLVKRPCVGLAGVWGQKTQPRRGSSRFLRPRRLTLRIQLASQACFSHVGPHKPSVFTWFRAFQAFLRPPVAPRGQKSHENAVRNHLSKGQLRDRSAQGPWLGGRALGAHAPLEIRPPSSKGAVLGRRGACW